MTKLPSVSLTILLCNIIHKIILVILSRPGTTETGWKEVHGSPWAELKCVFSFSYLSEAFSTHTMGTHMSTYVDDHQSRVHSRHPSPFVSLLHKPSSKRTTFGRLSLLQQIAYDGDVRNIKSNALDGRQKPSEGSYYESIIIIINK